MKKLKKDLPIMFLHFYSIIKDPLERKEFLDLYSYFCTVEQNLGVKLTEDEQKDLIKDSKIIPKQEINKLLFKFLERESLLEKKTNILGLSSTTYENISKNVQRSSINIENLKKDMRYTEDCINSAQNNLNRYTAVLFTQKRQFEQLAKAQDLSGFFTSEFDSIASNKDYTDVYYDEQLHVLHAVTKYDCVLDYENNRYNFGKYDVVYDILYNKVLIMPYEKNLYRTDSKNSIHTHVFPHLAMCYGTASASVTDAMKNAQISKVYNIVNMLLHAHNPASETDPIYLFNASYSIKNYQEFFYNLQIIKYIHKNKKLEYHYDYNTHITETVITPYIPEVIDNEEITETLPEVESA